MLCLAGQKYRKRKNPILINIEPIYPMQVYRTYSNIALFFFHFFNSIIFAFSAPKQRFKKNPETGHDPEPKTTQIGTQESRTKTQMNKSDGKKI